MSINYQLSPQENPNDEIRRVARELLSAALRHARRQDPKDPEEAVHETRKRFKEMRGLLRLTRPNLGEDIYQLENTRYRDLGRLLSELRDATALLETVDAVREAFKKEVQARVFRNARKKLKKRRKQVYKQQFRQEKRLAQVAEEIERAQAAIADWPLQLNSLADIGGGLEKVYKRGYKARKTALAEPTTENLHDWRKRVKYLRYHLQFLQDLWPPVLKKWYEETKTLTDYLGDDHDLAVFDEALENQVIDLENKQARMLLRGLSERKRKLLQKELKPLAKRIYAEKPGGFRQRMQAYAE